MYSTVQQTAYVVPTSKRKSHPSQKLFDSTVSLTVRGVPRKRTGVENNWQKNYGRSCWTADNSRYYQGSPLNRSNQRYSTDGVTTHSQPAHPQPAHPQPAHTQPAHPQPGYTRSYTTITPVNSGHALTLPSTTALPRTGQVKLTALHDQHPLSKTSYSRAKTVGVSTQRRQRVGEASKIATPTPRYSQDFDTSNVGDVTIADLQMIINTEFPETQGLVFNRASQYIRTTTADLMRAHSRPASQISAAALIPAEIRHPQARDSITPNSQKGSASTNIVRERTELNEQTTPNIDITCDDAMTADAERLIQERVSSALPVTVNIPTS